MVFRANVSPHWLDGGKRFWYRLETAPGKFETTLVDARTGKKTSPFDPATEGAGGSLTAYLPPHRSGNGSEEANLTVTNHSEIPVDVFWVDMDGKRVKYGHLDPGKSLGQHTYSDHTWLIADASGKALAAYSATAGDCTIVFDGHSPASAPRPKPAPESPDGSSRVLVRDHQLWRHFSDGHEEQLSTDGSDQDTYNGEVAWSPNGQYLAAMRVEPSQKHIVSFVRSSPATELQPHLEQFEYLKPGDKIEHPRLVIFDLANKKSVVTDQTLTPNPWALEYLHWSPDSREIYFVYNQRGHQVLRLLAADAATGKVRTVTEETSNTFIDYSQKTSLHFLDSGEAIWASERSGTNQLYLIDLKSGVTKPITKGPGLVRSVEEVDEGHRKLTLRVMGEPGQDPYHFHYARVDFDGSHFTKLTDGDGTHRLTWSPDGETYLDTYSRVDLGPQTELRRASDGHKLADLEQADLSHLEHVGWQKPERFTAKGRDGKTDIWGVIYRPSNFDPKKKYPVIESIYAGPHDFFVPKSFSAAHGTDRVTELGFVVVQIDGMGPTGGRRRFTMSASRTSPTPASRTEFFG